MAVKRLGREAELRRLIASERRVAPDLAHKHEGELAGLMMDGKDRRAQKSEKA